MDKKNSFLNKSFHFHHFVTFSLTLVIVYLYSFFSSLSLTLFISFSIVSIDFSIVIFFMGEIYMIFQARKFGGKLHVNTFHIHLDNGPVLLVTYMLLYNFYLAGNNLTQISLNKFTCMMRLRSMDSLAKEMSEEHMRESI